MKKDAKKVQPKVKVLKRKYVRPTLISYGKLSEFTASGGSGSPEAGQGQGQTFKKA